LRCDKLLSIVTQRHHSLRKLELRMPRKVRELKAQIAREGFVLLPKRGKGSHQRWRHPLLNKTLTISGAECTAAFLRELDSRRVGGKDGDDVPPYLEKQLLTLLNRLEQLRKEDENS